MNISLGVNGIDSLFKKNDFSTIIIGTNIYFIGVGKNVEEMEKNVCYRG
jgi:hypothetical protein